MRRFELHSRDHTKLQDLVRSSALMPAPTRAPEECGLQSELLALRDIAPARDLRRPIATPAEQGALPELPASAGKASTRSRQWPGPIVPPEQGEGVYAEVCPWPPAP